MDIIETYAPVGGAWAPPGRRHRRRGVPGVPEDRLSAPAAAGEKELNERAVTPGRE